MDAFQFLRAEHRKASDLLQRLKEAGNKAERERLFVELKQDLESDAEVEKEYLYPPLLKGEGTADLAGGGINDLNRLHDLLAKLDTLPKEGNEWRETLDQLQQTMDEHMRKEEETLFRRARRVLSEPLREDLGERMRIHKMHLIEGGARNARQRSDGHADERGTERDRDDRGTEGMDLETTTTDDLARFAKERSRGFVEHQARNLADQVQGVVKAIRQTAENMKQQQDQAQLSSYLHQAAGGLEQVSGILREGDMDRLVARSSEFAKRQPALFMGGAVMAGFLLTRLLKSSERRAASH